MHDLVWFSTRPAIAVDGSTRLFKVVCLGGLPTCQAGVRSIDEADLWIGWHRDDPTQTATILAAAHGYGWLDLGI
jgi:hypothetical protein